MRLSPKSTGIAAAIVTVTIWTAFIVIARASAARHLTPFDLAFCRILGAGLVLLPWGAWLVRHQTGPGWLGLSPLPWRTTVVTGFFGGLVYSVLAYCGFFFAPASHASVLMPGSLPLWTSLLAIFLLGERIKGSRAIGLALIVGGALMVGGTSLLHAFDDGASVWKGDLLFMTASLCWATYGVLARTFGLDAVRATIAITVFAFLCYVPLYFTLAFTGVVPSQLFTAPGSEVAFQMAFQGVGSVVISGITFTLMIQHFGPVRTTMITALVPGLSALGAVLMLGEPMYWNLLAGLALVTLGILFGVRGVPRIIAPISVAKSDVSASTSG
ncbi:MAG: DMT family transporter [Burkholderiaceae bacterium]